MKSGPKPKVHCKRMHELSGENLYVSPKGQRHCKACRKVTLSLFRENHRKGRVRDQRSLKRRKKEQLVAYKGGECFDCKGKFPPCCFHFDHRNPMTKLFCIGQKMAKPIEWLKSEMDKCDLVCANCHAIRTFGSEEISQKIMKSRAHAGQ